VARAYETGAIRKFRSFSAEITTLSMGSVKRDRPSLARRPAVSFFVVWLDAHADYNTPATTLSGNMHGMSAAFLCGEPGLELPFGW